MNQSIPCVFCFHLEITFKVKVKVNLLPKGSHQHYKCKITLELYVLLYRSIDGRDGVGQVVSFCCNQPTRSLFLFITTTKVFLATRSTNSLVGLHFIQHFGIKNVTEGLSDTVFTACSNNVTVVCNI